ncbi:hypothetical protein ACLOJK_008469 [Asimina triloba]
MGNGDDVLSPSPLTPIDSGNISIVRPVTASTGSRLPHRRQRLHLRPVASSRSDSHGKRGVRSSRQWRKSGSSRRLTGRPTEQLRLHLDLQRASMTAIFFGGCFVFNDRAGRAHLLHPSIDNRSSSPVWQRDEMQHLQIANSSRAASKSQLRQLVSSKSSCTMAGSGSMAEPSSLFSAKINSLISGSIFTAIQNPSDLANDLTDHQAVKHGPPES